MSPSSSTTPLPSSSSVSPIVDHGIVDGSSAKKKRTPAKTIKERFTRLTKQLSPKNSGTDSSKQPLLSVPLPSPSSVQCQLYPIVQNLEDDIGSSELEVIWNTATAKTATAEVVPKPTAAATAVAKSSCLAGTGTAIPGAGTASSRTAIEDSPSFVSSSSSEELDTPSLYNLPGRANDNDDDIRQSPPSVSTNTNTSIATQSLLLQQEEYNYDDDLSTDASDIPSSLRSLCSGISSVQSAVTTSTAIKSHKRTNSANSSSGSKIKSKSLHVRGSSAFTTCGGGNSNTLLYPPPLPNLERARSDGYPINSLTATATKKDEQQKQQQKPPVIDLFHSKYVLTRRMFPDSSVWECVERCTGSRYCVKLSTNQQEIDRLQRAQGHGGIVRLVDSFCMAQAVDGKSSKNASPLYSLVTPLSDRNLWTEILRSSSKEKNTGSEGGMPVATVQNYMRQIVRAIHHLHANCHMVHGHLEPSHILLTGDTNNIVQICDFDDDGTKYGLATSSSSARVYQAPEASTLTSLSSSAKPHFPVDMWSIGVLAYICLSGTSTSQSSPLTHKTLLRKIHTQQLSRYNRDVKKFLINLIAYDPDVRWTADEALKSSWIAPEDHHQAQQQRHLHGSTSPRSKEGHQRSASGMSVKNALSRLATSLHHQQQSPTAAAATTVSSVPTLDTVSSSPSSSWDE